MTTVPKHLHALLVLLLVVVLHCTSPVSAATVGVPVSTFTGVYGNLQDFCTGVMTAAKTTSSISFVSSSISSSSGNSIYSTFMNAKYAAMLGPMGTTLLGSIYAGTAITSSSLIVFSPLVQDFTLVKDGSISTYVNVPQVYFTMPHETVEAAAIITFCTWMESFPTLFVSMASTSTNDYILNSSTAYIFSLTKLTSQYGYTLGYFSESFYTSSVQKKLTTAMIYSLGMSDVVAISQQIPWMTAVASDPIFIARNTTMFFTSQIAYVFWALYQDLGATKLPPANIISVSPVPGVDSTEYAVSQAFAQLREANFPTLKTNNELLFAMAGWVNGLALIQALTMLSSSNTNSNGPMSNFYHNLGAAQSNFLVYDMVTGPFGTSCPAMAVQQGATCCQSGGRNVFFQQMTQVSGGYDWAAMQQVYTYPRGVCADVVVKDKTIPATAQVPAPFHALGFLPTDNAMISYMCEQTQAVVRVMSNTTLYGLTSSHPYRMYCLPTTMSTMSADFATFSGLNHMNALNSAVPDVFMTSSTDGFTLDFIPQTTQPAITKSNLFYLFPTMEQELYLLATYLRSIATTPTKVCAVVQSSTVSTAIVSLLQKSLATFALSFSNADMVVPTSAALAVSIPDGCSDTFVIGLGDGDVAALVSYLQSTATSRVYISFDDLTKYYSDFQAQALLQQRSGLTDRLIFATNLPSWTATTSVSSTAAMSGLTTHEQFLQSVSPSLHTPAALRAFFAAAMLSDVSSVSSPQLSILKNVVYTKRLLPIGGLDFGPYLTTAVELSGSDGSNVPTNYGARDIAVWSVSRILDPSTPLLMAPSTPSLLYSSSGSAALSPLSSVGSEQAGLSMIPSPASVVGAVRQEDCIAVESSSEASAPSAADSTIIITTPRPALPSREPTATHSSSHSNADDSTSDTMTYIFIILGAVCILAWCIVGVLFLRLRCGCRPPRLPMAWCGSAASRASRLCSRRRAGMEDLCKHACDPSWAPLPSGVATLVVLDIPGVWQGWAATPETMREKLKTLITMVRQLVVSCGCNEMAVVGGTFIISCPSPHEAVVLLRRVASDALAAGARMALHTASCASSSMTDRGWWCGDDVAHTVLHVCSLARPGELLVTKDALGALGGTEPSTLLATPFALDGDAPARAGVALTLRAAAVCTPADASVTSFSELEVAGVMRCLRVGKECLLDAPTNAVREVVSAHYRCLGADVAALDAHRVCFDFALPVDVTAPHQSSLDTVVDRTAALLLCRHSGRGPYCVSEPPTESPRVVADRPSQRSNKSARRRRSCNGGKQLCHFAYSLETD